MKANELRIGNWINNHEGKPEQIDGEGIAQFSDGELTAPDGINTFICPIRLTPEWMEKFGFELERITYSIDTEEGQAIEFRLPGLLYLAGVNSTTLGECFTVFNMHHVHQLQNLYFALTGEELTYTP